MPKSRLFYITLKDIQPAQNRYRVYTIVVDLVRATEEYQVTLSWGKIYATKQRKVYTCPDRDALDKFITKVLAIRLKHGYALVELHEQTPSYPILQEFEQGESLYPPSQLSLL